MKILHKIVLQFYLGAFYSVDLSFTGIFLHHILGFYTLFSFISSGTSAESSALTLVLAFHFSAAKQSESPETAVFHYAFAFQEISFKTHLIFSSWPTPDSTVNPPSYQKVLFLLYIFQA